MKDTDIYEKNRIGIFMCTLGMMLCITRQLNFVFHLNQGEYRNIHIYYPVPSTTILAFTYLCSLLKTDLFYETRKYFIPFALGLVLDIVIAVVSTGDSEIHIAPRIGMLVQLAFNAAILACILVKSSFIKPYIKIDDSQVARRGLPIKLQNSFSLTCPAIYSYISSCAHT